MRHLPFWAPGDHFFTTTSLQKGGIGICFEWLSLLSWSWDNFHFFFWPILEDKSQKNKIAGWAPKFRDQPKLLFDSVNYHIWTYENAWKTWKSLYLSNRWSPLPPIYININIFQICWQIDYLYQSICHIYPKVRRRNRQCVNFPNQYFVIILSISLSIYLKSVNMSIIDMHYQYSEHLYFQEQNICQTLWLDTLHYTSNPVLWF